jgi:radical SAM superfamily enzyme YgiQ (UPF0313 family)
MRVTFLILKDYRHIHNMTSGPIGLAYLSSAAKVRFPDIHIQIEVDPDRVIESKPDIIGISAYTESYSQSIDAARYLQKNMPGTPIWLGGPHVNALPLTLDRNFDLGVVGEGEVTFVELLELYEQGRMQHEYMQHVKGLVYWHEGKRHLTPPRETFEDIDQLPPPDRSIMQTYWPPTKQMIKWAQPIYTSRGCPFKCVFCIFSMESAKVRYHSVDRVVEEIKEILRHNPEQEHVTIHDDLFALSKKRLRELTAGIRAAGLHKKVSFVCMAKASVFSDEMAQLMREMNVSIVTFGLESGVERILHYLKGPRNKVSENVNAIDICARHGIRMGGYFIIGTPTETYEELQQAYWFIRDHFPPMSMAGVYRLTPFPGTKFWQEAIEMGVVSNDMEDWKPFNYLDADKRDFLFFNQHYDYDAFQEAYAQFSKITYKNHLAFSTERQELAYKKLLDPLYEDMLLDLRPTQVLEISGLTRMSSAWVAEELQLDLQVDTVRPWALDALEELPSDYDLVICALALETSEWPAEKLTRVLESKVKPGGRLLFIVYNPGHESLLNHILSGSWNSNYWGSRPFDLVRMLNVKSLSQWLKFSQPESIAPLSAQEENSILSAEVMALLGEIPQAGAALAETRHVAYTVLTTPVQSVTTGLLESEQPWETSLNV